MLEPPRQGVHNDPTGYNLNIAMQACDCGMWQEHGYPCIHAVAVFKKQELNFAELLERVDDIHTYEMNTELFKRNFLTVCIEKVVPDRTVFAPMFKPRNVGRTKKKRHRKRARLSTGSPDANGTQGARTTRVNKCRNCGGVGHNARTCLSAKQPYDRTSRGRVVVDRRDSIPDVDLL